MTPSRANPVPGAQSCEKIEDYEETEADKKAEAAQHDLDAEFPQDNAILLPAQYDRDNNPSKTIFIVPRNKQTIFVGSIIQRNHWDLGGLTLESPEAEDMWERATKFVPALGTREPHARPLARGLRPFSHSNVRVSADNRTTACRVVHNYGHGGSGWTLAIGCARTCVRIVDKLLHEDKSGFLFCGEPGALEVRGLN